VIKVIVLVATLLFNGQPTYQAANQLDEHGVPYTEKSCTEVANAIIERLEMTKPAEGTYAVSCQYMDVDVKTGSI